MAGRAAFTQSSAGAEITERTIRAHMEFLAGDALNGRGSGTRDEWLAAAYVASQFRLWGLEPMGDDGGYVQRIGTGAETAAPPVLTIGGAALTHGKEILVVSLMSASISGPLVRLEAGAQAAPGSIVLLAEGANPNQTTGPALVLAPETTAMRQQWITRGSRMPAIVSRAVSPAGASARPTVIYLDKNSYAAAGALAPGTAVTFTPEMKPTFTWNAIARLPGSEAAGAKDVIVLSAHLDHVGARPASSGTDTIYNGADDDASGTVAVMTLAEALAKGLRPRRTVVFALFGSEERGGFGAGHFVDLPVVPLGQIVADLQFEMLGRPDSMLPPHTLWLTGYERSNLGPELAKQGARLVADPRPDQSFFTRSDNIRFARRGVVAHTVSSFGLHKEYHQASDELRFIDFAHMTDAINSLLAPVRWLANSDFRPAWNAGGCPAPCK
jgi:hypothetical protein